MPEGARRSAQHTGPLGCETRSGCWANSRPIADRVLSGTLMDMPRDQKEAFPLLPLQRSHVAPLSFREGTPVAPGATPGAGIELASGNSNHVLSLCNPKSTLLCPMGPSIPGSSP